MPSTPHLSTPCLVVRGSLAILFGFAAHGHAVAAPSAIVSPSIAPPLAASLPAPFAVAVVKGAPVHAAPLAGAAVRAAPVAVAVAVAVAVLQAAPTHVAGLGVPAGAHLLDSARGGSDGLVTNASLRGTVSGNSTTNVITGGNTIQASSFAGASGIPIVIQNSGANVLIQNATVINLQFQ